MNLRRSKLLVASGLIIVLTSILPVDAQTWQATINNENLEHHASINSSDLEIFLDDFFNRNMNELHIPGAAIAVVKDGEILLSKGYGLADLDQEIPVDPAQTIMRIGSISKLFTATAAMQLVEQGSLDLDTDLNQYLNGFQIPKDSFGPITLQQLLTHTAGFEDRVIGRFALDPDEVIPLGEYLKNNIPARDLKPGTVHSYSNFSLALTGLLIEDVSGLPFAQYVEEMILQPLGMSRSTFEQPLPSELVEDLALGYFYKDGAYKPGDFAYELESPAGAMSSTVEDMANFMIAHLQDGRFEDVRILEEATAQRMHEQQFTHHSDLPGLGYAFKERFVNGEHLIGHGGDIGTYSSQMILHLEDNLGLFVVYNIFNDTLRERLITEFMDRYYPEQSASQIQNYIQMSADELARFAGSYRWVRYERSTIGKLQALVPGPINVKIEANDDGTLSVFFFGAKPEWRYAPVEPLLFKQIVGGVQEFGGLAIDLGDTLAFREEEVGAIQFAFVPLQNVALQKIAWYEISEVQLGILGTLMLIFPSPLIVWPLGALIGKLLKKRPDTTAGARRAKRVGAIVCGLNFSFMLIMFFAFGDISFGVPLAVQIALAIPILTAVLTVIMLFMSFLAWIKGYWSFLGRIYYSFLTLSAMVFLIWAYYWNLIGWKL